VDLYNAVGDVVAKLSSIEYSQWHVKQVNKGTLDKPRWQSVIDWQENVYMLDDTFGPFGWSAEIVGSTSDYANGVYTVDMTLTGRALDAESGAVLELKRPGRGVGIVPRSAITSDSEHDRQAHGAKSDAITNAAKALGDGFGLWLYNEAKRKEFGGASQPTTSAPRSGQSQSSSGSDKRPSDKQMFHLSKNGYSDEQVAGMSFDEWKGTLDAIFGGQTPAIAPAAKQAAAKNPAPKATKTAKAAPTEEYDIEPDEIPF
jgi:hypothetical protein